MSRVLVVGGAGYIGSHMMKTLSVNGYEAVALDNLSTGYRDAVIHGELVVADLQDQDSLTRFLSERRFDAVMHFASSIEVGESVRNPQKFYQNNVCNTLNLIHAMMRSGLDKLIFSSTAAVYGIPNETPIPETTPLRPINPYGHTKVMIEQILSDYRTAYGFANFALRYFNAAGADPSGELGERHDPETHLIPLAIQAALGHRECLTIYGQDYDTPDGTCVRDYVHVNDICRAHLLALEQLFNGHLGDSFNLGNGSGFSVLEVINAVERVTGRKLPMTLSGRRPGDPCRLVADASRIQAELGWATEFSDLDSIVETAVKFYQSANIVSSP